MTIPRDFLNDILEDALNVACCSGLHPAHEAAILRAAAEASEITFGSFDGCPVTLAGLRPADTRDALPAGCFAFIWAFDGRMSDCGLPVGEPIPIT